jgi:hypothetical protein
MLQLHAQAVERGLCNGSEAVRLRVLALAEHAAAVGSRNPAGLFASLLRKKLWGYATADDDDAARKRLRNHLHQRQRDIRANLPECAIEVRQPTREPSRLAVLMAQLDARRT